MLCKQMYYRPYAIHAFTLTRSLTLLQQVFLAGQLMLPRGHFSEVHFTPREWKYIRCVGNRELVFIASPEFTLSAADLMEEVDVCAFSDSLTNLLTLTPPDMYWRTNLSLTFTSSHHQYQVTHVRSYVYCRAVPLTEPSSFSSLAPASATSSVEPK